MLDMVTGDTFFLYVKGIPKFADIPIIVLIMRVFSIFIMKSIFTGTFTVIMPFR
ncbi:MAG: hypothetical protein MAG551_01525 [Candidatus Scalindua arabica]|uniref:Uncharacterized protein n=1 Tax=Candidatus Scalindua arabica TaxID=1127984 RepID=A0A942A2J5_9BACT|nr:hypothetical protein [Candidatus Scalindua arabica]